MMKAKDLSVATSLLIQGWMHANVDRSVDPQSDSAMMELATAIAAIRQECEDWAENLEGHAKASELALSTTRDNSSLIDLDAVGQHIELIDAWRATGRMPDLNRLSVTCSTLRKLAKA